MVISLLFCKSKHIGVYMHKIHYPHTRLQNSAWTWMAIRNALFDFFLHEDVCEGQHQTEWLEKVQNGFAAR